MFGEEHRETATSKSDLGLLLLRRGDLDAAEQMLRENLDTTTRVLGADHPNAAAATTSLASLMIARGDGAGAEVLLRKALEVNRRLFPNKPIEYVGNLNTLAAALELQRRLEESEAVLDECLRIARSNLRDDHPRVLTYTANMARVRIARGAGAATESSLRRVLGARQRFYPAADWRIAQAQSLLGAALMAQARYAEAEPLMIAADNGLQPIAGPQARERLANRARLVSLYGLLKRPQQADFYR